MPPPRPRPAAAGARGARRRWGLPPTAWAPPKPPGRPAAGPDAAGPALTIEPLWPLDAVDNEYASGPARAAATASAAVVRAKDPTAPRAT